MKVCECVTKIYNEHKNEKQRTYMYRYVCVYVCTVYTERCNLDLPPPLIPAHRINKRENLCK